MVLSDGIILPVTVALYAPILVLEGEAGALTVTVGVRGGCLGTSQAQAGGGGDQVQQGDSHQGGPTALICFLLLMPFSLSGSSSYWAPVVIRVFCF